jgi:hypothetical protein
MTKTKTMTPIARKWHQRLDSGVLTRGQVRELATGILARSFGDIGGHRSNMTEDEAQAILDRVSAEKPRITQEQTDFGLHWLRTTGKRAGFDPAILDDFIEFRLDDIEWWDSGFRLNGYARWCIITGSGEWTYSWEPWQRQSRPRLHLNRER